MTEAELTEIEQQAARYNGVGRDLAMKLVTEVRRLSRDIETKNRLMESMVRRKMEAV